MFKFFVAPPRAAAADIKSNRSHGIQMDINKPRYTPMSRRRRIYEGKAKVLYEGPEPGTLIQHFKDDATAFNAKKHQVIEGKGVLNNRISEYVFQRLNDMGKTVVMVTHEPDVAAHCKRIVRMRDGVVARDEVVVKPRRAEDELAVGIGAAE